MIKYKILNILYYITFFILIMIPRVQNKVRYDAGIIFLHGLGDSGSSFTDFRHRYSQQYPGLKWLFPDATVQPVTVNGGMRMRSWFDIDMFPLTSGEYENPNGLQDSINRIHSMIEELESEGINSERIIVAGFSQGAVVSLTSGLSYEKKLGGIIAFSGWLAKFNDVDEWINEENKNIPILISAGREDDVVPCHLSRDAQTTLNGIGVDDVTMEIFPHLPHSFDIRGMNLMSELLEKVYGEN